MVLYLLVNLGNPSKALKGSCGCRSSATVDIPVSLETSIGSNCGNTSVQAATRIPGFQGDVFTQIQDINGRYQG